jgi:ubiquinone/menaquinone biosynthesis C-methylase UbiE
MIEYFERRAASYRTRSARGLWSLVRRREYSAVARLLDLHSGQSMLDLGCGAGHYAFRLQQEFGVKVLAVDSSPGMLKQVLTPKIKTWLGRAEDMPEHRQFDRILAAGLLEFVDRPEIVLRKCAALTAQNARVVLLIPAAGVRGLIYKSAHEWAGCPVYIRSQKHYIRLAEACGLQLIETDQCTPMSAALAFRRVERAARK